MTPTFILTYSFFTALLIIITRDTFLTRQQATLDALNNYFTTHTAHGHTPHTLAHHLKKHTYISHHLINIALTNYQQHDKLRQKTQTYK